MHERGRIASLIPEFHAYNQNLHKTLQAYHAPSFGHRKISILYADNMVLLSLA